MPSSPCSPPESQTSRGTIPSFSHWSWKGTTFFSAHARTIVRKSSCSASYRSWRMPLQSARGLRRRPRAGDPRRTVVPPGHWTACPLSTGSPRPPGPGSPAPSCSRRAAQEGAWDAISSGEHALVVAPTGSGKTLAAFLWSLDRLAATPPAGRGAAALPGPLRLPAQGAGRRRRAQPARPADRHRPGRGPAGSARARRSGSASAPATPRPTSAAPSPAGPTDILITTPESLFLLLTSAAREALRGIETVIVDEVHAVADTKRGAHLAVSLDRLDELLERPAQRIGLSATVRPIEEVATFLAGGRPVQIVAPPSQKEWDLSVVVPVEDMSELGQPTGELEGSAAGNQPRTSIWPAVEERVLDLVAGAPQHDRLRQLPAAGRAADQPAQRAGLRTGHRRAGAAGHQRRRAHGAGRLGRRHPRGHPAGGGRPPRLGVPRAAGDRRGGAEVRPAARRRGHLQPRARHRHGRGRPRRPGRGAAHGRRRACSGSAGPGTRSARSAAASCSRSTAATWCSARWSPSG